MDGSAGFLARLRRALWAAAAGLALAGLCIFLVQTSAMWAAAIGIVGALAVVVLPQRGRAEVDAASVVAPDPIPSFSPLAEGVFEHLPDPLMLLDAADRVLFANAAMRAIVGAATERKHVSAILRNPNLLAALARTALTGDAEQVEFTFHVPVERTYQAYAMRVGAEPGVTALLLHDLTSQKRSEQMRVDFVANASHELRTPLAAVTGFIETLKGHARDDPAAREKFLDIMAVEAGRMRRLIDDLLSLSRIELNEHVPPLGEVALESVAREAVTALRPLARADDISIELSAAEDLPPVSGERDELIQLFQNLIHNAIKYGRPGGHVWVTLSPAPASGRGADQVIASVRDDGEGIPSEAIPRLTERFYRVDVKRSREKGGTGLGLAIVKHIANRHQGRLQIESHAGEGSTFTVFLPVARSTLASTPSVAAQ
jgi:two-component system, OmpR family, phosphate regulon sensor histidine kinase PhoR